MQRGPYYGGETINTLKYCTRPEIVNTGPEKYSVLRGFIIVEVKQYVRVSVLDTRVFNTEVPYCGCKTISIGPEKQCPKLVYYIQRFNFPYCGAETVPQDIYTLHRTSQRPPN